MSSIKYYCRKHDRHSLKSIDWCEFLEDVSMKYLECSPEEVRKVFRQSYRCNKFNKTLMDIVYVPGEKDFIYKIKVCTKCRQAQLDERKLLTRQEKSAILVIGECE